MTKAVFQLEALTCPSCIKKIENTLKKTLGVESARVLFNASKVKTEFDEGLIGANQIEEMILKLGYLVVSTKVS